MQKNPRLSQLTAALWAALPLLCTSFIGDGATVFAFRDHRVQMLEETIRVRYSPKENKVRPWAADCRFVFKNLTRKPVTVQMGFPDWRTAGEAPRGGAIAAFSASVDGKPVPATRKTVDNTTSDKKAKAKVSKGKRRSGVKLARRVRLAYDAAYTWPVTIAAGGKVTVRNRYRFGGFASNGPLRACTNGRSKASLRSLFWRRAKRKKGGLDYENGVCRALQYIVTSGRTWAKTIGKADIAIELPPDVWPNMVLPFPRASEVTTKWVRWQRKNWRPKKELSVVFLHPITQTRAPSFDTAAQARAWLRYAKRHGFSRGIVEVMAQAQAAATGLAVKTPAFYQGLMGYSRPKKSLAKNQRLSAILEVLGYKKK
jgi:hypothetical protein